MEDSGTESADHQLGYFALNHKSMPSKQDLFGQLWKEYAFSDSRYMTSDPFVLCMETVTAVSNTGIESRTRADHTLPGVLGSSLFLCRSYDHAETPTTPSIASNGLSGPNLR